jgi:type I restriction enzyme S subunit
MDGGGKFPSSFEKYKVVKKGYMAFCLFDVDETPRTVALTEYDGMLTGAYTIMSVQNVNARYVYYYYLMIDNQKMLRPLYTGLRKTIKIETFQNTKLPVPPREEQDQIVRFLDWKVSEIDNFLNLLHKELKIIDELKNNKIILSVFGLCSDDKDLLPNDWGEYLKRTSSSWKIVRLKNVLSKHFTGFWGENPAGQSDKRCIRVADFNFDRAEVNREVVTFRHYNETEIKKGSLLPGDILLEKSGGGEKTPVGRVVQFMGGDKDETLCSNFVECLRVDKDIVNPDYLTNVLKSFYLSTNMVGYFKQTTGIQNVDLNAYLSIKIPIPSKNEQEQICQRISQRSQAIDKMTDNVKMRINCLRELKKSLIADVVTGKIDVRGIDIPEYETVEEIEDAFDEDPDDEFMMEEEED